MHPIILRHQLDCEHNDDESNQANGLRDLNKLIKLPPFQVTLNQVRKEARHQFRLVVELGIENTSQQREWSDNDWLARIYFDQEEVDKYTGRQHQTCSRRRFVTSTEEMSDFAALIGCSLCQLRQNFDKRLNCQDRSTSELYYIETNNTQNLEISKSNGNHHNQDGAWRPATPFVEACTWRRRHLESSSARLCGASGVIPPCSKLWHLWREKRPPRGVANNNNNLASRSHKQKINRGEPEKDKMTTINEWAVVFWDNPHAQVSVSCSTGIVVAAPARCLLAISETINAASWPLGVITSDATERKLEASPSFISSIAPLASEPQAGSKPTTTRLDPIRSITIELGQIYQLIKAGVQTEKFEPVVSDEAKVHPIEPNVAGEIMIVPSTVSYLDEKKQRLDISSGDENENQHHGWSANRQLYRLSCLYLHSWSSSNILRNQFCLDTSLFARSTKYARFRQCNDPRPAIDDDIQDHSLDGPLRRPFATNTNNSFEVWLNIAWEATKTNLGKNIIQVIIAIISQMTIFCKQKSSIIDFGLNLDEDSSTPNAVNRAHAGTSEKLDSVSHQQRNYSQEFILNFIPGSSKSSLAPLVGAMSLPITLTSGKMSHSSSNHSGSYSFKSQTISSVHVILLILIMTFAMSSLDRSRTQVSAMLLFPSQSSANSTTQSGSPLSGPMHLIPFEKQSIRPSLMIMMQQMSKSAVPNQYQHSNYSKTIQFDRTTNQLAIPMGISKRIDVATTKTLWPRRGQHHDTSVLSSEDSTKLSSDNIRRIDDDIAARFYSAAIPKSPDSRRLEHLGNSYRSRWTRINSNRDEPANGTGNESASATDSSSSSLASAGSFDQKRTRPLTPTSLQSSQSSSSSWLSPSSSYGSSARPLASLSSGLLSLISSSPSAQLQSQWPARWNSLYTDMYDRLLSMTVDESRRPLPRPPSSLLSNSLNSDYYRRRQDSTRKPGLLRRTLNRIGERIGARNSIRIHNAFRDFAWRVLSSLSMPTPIIYELRRQNLYSPLDDMANDDLYNKNTTKTIRIGRKLREYLQSSSMNQLMDVMNLNQLVGKSSAINHNEKIKQSGLFLNDIMDHKPTNFSLIKEKFPLRKTNGKLRLKRSVLNVKTKRQFVEQPDLNFNNGARERFRARVEDLVRLSRNRPLFGRVIKLPSLLPFRRRREEMPSYQATRNKQSTMSKIRDNKTNRNNDKKSNTKKVGKPLVSDPLGVVLTPTKTLVNNNRAYGDTISKTVVQQHKITTIAVNEHKRPNRLRLFTRRKDKNELLDDHQIINIDGKKFYLDDENDLKPIN